MELSIAALRQRRGIKWHAYPPDVLPAWVADMDFAVSPAITAALEAAVARHDFGYAAPYEQSGLDEIFCARMHARFGWRVVPDQVEFFSDVVQIIYLSLLTLTTPGAGVVIQTPIYPPFLQAAKETGRRAVIAPLVQGATGYSIDLDATAACIDRETQMLLLCHPHNPTGRAYTREELRGLAELVIKHDLLVVSDEIHADLMLDERVHIPFASLGSEIAARTITLTSPSKPFNIAGLCLAVAVFGNEQLQRRFASIPAHVRGGRSVLGIAAANAAWAAGQPWLEEVTQRLRSNRALVAEFVKEHWRSVRHTPPEATYLAWLDCRALELSVEPYRFFLEQAKVALSEGPTFGEAGRGFVRLNFATSPPILREILTRMDQAIAKHQR